ncbi:MAG: hypothetical protein VX278_16370 [Myxococcota bacterium]|nr:hypothetical protein [Myxococcota bacterium]
MFLILSSFVAAEPLNETALVTIAASLVEMATVSDGISEEERSLLKKKFPLRGDLSPVTVFTLDRSDLPKTMASLPLEQKKRDRILNFLGLVALVDGNISTGEYEYLQRYHESLQSTLSLKEHMNQSQSLYHSIQHEPMLETMRLMAEAEAKYHQKHKRYLDAKQCPKRGSKKTSWSKCSNVFKNLPWTPPETVIGSYKIEATQNSFVITGLIDVDGDGSFATYVSTHTTPKPKRIGNTTDN